MGNEQSVESPPRPKHKLSKPRTNTPGNGTPKRSPAPPSRRNSLPGVDLELGTNGYNSTLTLNVGDDLQTVPDGQRDKTRRKSFLRLRSSTPKLEIDISNGAAVDFVDRNPVVRSRMRNTALLESPVSPPGQHLTVERPPLRTTRMSLQHVPYAQQAHHSPVEEGPSPSNSYRSAYSDHREQEQQALGEQNARAYSVDDIHGTIRRKSLRQPGLATRDNWAVDDSRQFLPSQHQHGGYRDEQFDPVKPLVSQHSNITAVRSTDPTYIPGSRVETPENQDYAHTGAYKLGSLRITNGTASPVPSLEKHPREKYNPAPIVPDHRYAPTSVPARPWSTGKAEPFPINQHARQPPTINTHLPPTEFSLFRFSDQDASTNPRQQHADSAMSPFSFTASPPHSPTLEATSKNMAVDDQLFDSESITPTPSVHEPEFPTALAPRLDTQPVRVVRGPRPISPKRLTKADSGYSSKLSLRSVTSATSTVPTKDSSPTPPKNSAGNSRSTYSAPQVQPSEVSDSTLRKLPSIPSDSYREAPTVLFDAVLDAAVKNEVVPPRNEVASPPVPTKSPAPSTPAAQSKPRLLTKRRSQERTPSNPSIFRAAWQDNVSSSPAASESPSSTGGSSSWRSRSRSRTRTSTPSTPVFTVQALPSAEPLDVPPVPAETSRRLSERVVRFPTSNLPNTSAGNPAIRRAGSRETLGTIFSVGSAEVREEMSYNRLSSALPAAPPETILENPASPSQTNKRASYQSPSTTMPARKPVQNRHSLQPGPRTSHLDLAEKVQQDDSAQVTYFDHIPSKSGGSPHSMAIPEDTQHRQAEQNTADSLIASPNAATTAHISQGEVLPHIPQRSGSLHRTTSYDSISSRSVQSSQDQLAPTRPYSTLGTRRSNSSLRSDAVSSENRLSSHSIGRIKSPPPVSMQTQRLPASLVINPPSRALPKVPQQASRPLPSPTSNLPSTPNLYPNSASQTPADVVHPPARTTSPLPAPRTASPHSDKEVHDPWSKQREFWASRKAEALQNRKSMELSRPNTARSIEVKSHVPEVPRTPRQPPRSRTLPNTPVDHHPRHSDQLNRPTWRNNGWEQPWEEKAYDHTYGSEDHHSYNKENLHAAHDGPEAEYYESPSQTEEATTSFSSKTRHAVHRASTSTSDMLILDRYAGGLDFGYEPGAGLGGSAGTRNSGIWSNAARTSVPMSREYGVDFSDVPVFLQRVKIG